MGVFEMYGFAVLIGIAISAMVLISHEDEEEEAN